MNEQTIKAKNLNYTHLGRDITVISNVNTVSLSGKLAKFTMWEQTFPSVIDGGLVAPHVYEQRFERRTFIEAKIPQSPCKYQRERQSSSVKMSGRTLDMWDR